MIKSNFISAFRNSVALVYNRVKQLHQPSFILFWKKAILGLYEYLTFKKL